MILLDTCALLWFLHDDPMLPERVAERIEESEKVYLSIASLWEVAIKKTIKKLDIPETVKELEKKCEEKQIMMIGIRNRKSLISFLQGDLIGGLYGSLQIASFLFVPHCSMIFWRNACFSADRWGRYSTSEASLA